jgi:Flp pilus assembly protein TadD
VIAERASSVFDQLERMSAPLRQAQQDSSSCPSGTISVYQLRHPLSRKGQQLIERGQRYAKVNQQAKAILEFKRALEEASAAPYAHGLLGIEYLKLNDASSAIVELREAVQMLPGIAANHTNLGYALCLTGQRKWAERELREAVRLDRTSFQARYLLGLLQLDQRSQEAEQNLAIALQGMQKARLALAVVHARAGDAESAGQDIRGFLGRQRLQETESTAQWVAKAATLDQPSILFGLPAFASSELP